MYSDNIDQRIVAFIENISPELKAEILLCSFTVSSTEDGEELIIVAPNPDKGDDLFYRQREIEAAAQAFSMVTIMAKEGSETYVRPFPVRPISKLLLTASSSIKIMAQIQGSNYLEKIQQRVEKYSNLLQAIAHNTVSTYVHDAREESDFQFLEVAAVLPQRLNKQREELIGQSLSVISPAIAEPRRFYLKKAAETGLVQRWTYTYEDSHFWEFNCSAAPIPGTEEILVITQDVQPWQLGYWLNKVKV